jgi:hypothetical protein
LFGTEIDAAVGLDQHEVDVGDADDFIPTADGIDHAGQRKVARGAQDALTTAADQRYGIFGDGVVGKAVGIQLGRR